MNGLPHFRFYPTAYEQFADRPSAFDPHGGACPLCSRSTGWGFTCGEGDDFCPFCIADGSLAELQGAYPINRIEVCSDNVLRAEVQLRTPRLASMQDYAWPVAANAPMIYAGIKCFDDVRDDVRVWPAVLAAAKQWGAPDDEKAIRRFLGPACGWLHVFRSRDGTSFRAILDGT